MDLQYGLRLQKMIRCRTVSKQDSYDDAEFSALRAVMEELFPLIHRNAELMRFSQDCWIYKLKGTDESRNIMLMSHHDVVDAGDGWTYPPFSGEIAEGRIWGRGTVDTKTPLFAIFSALEELLSEGFAPPVNIYIGSSHNEEIAGDGIPSALEYFKQQDITFEVVLDEGGAVIDPPLAGMKCEKCAMVAVHEKGRYKLICTAETEAGHSSLTAAAKRSPVERMSAFIHEITTSDPFIRRLNPQVKAMFAHLAPYCAFPMKQILSNLWLFGPVLRRVMPKLNPQAGGMIGTSCAFNSISGDTKTNRCTAIASFRAVDASDMGQDLETFFHIAEKYAIQVQIAPGSEYHEPADMTAVQFAYTLNCIREIFPAYPPAPFILPAGTDARTLTDICPCVLRFAPIRLSARQLASVHGKDENIDLSAITDAVAFYKYFVKNYR